MDTLHKKIGQLFVIGFPGETPPSPFLNFVEEEQIGGIILFQDNCPTHIQARENIETIGSCIGDSLPLVAVDQEGGRVCRLKGVPAEYRAAAAYASAGDIEHFIEDYSRSTVVLQSLGFNLNLAPVADIYLNPENSCLANRCFGTDPETVADFVRAAVDVTKRQGMLSCLKHFPGLGAATVDPHLAASVAEYDELLWKQRERVPFAAGLEFGADLVMTTHLRLPAVDNDIATESMRIVSNWLRGELRFDGPVITDDMLMAGAGDLSDIGERSVRALQAGHDILLFGRNYEKAMEAYDYVSDAVKHGDLDPMAIQASLDRVAGLKYRLGRPAIRH